MTEERYLLVLNAGSSSLKFELFAARASLASVLAGAVRDLKRPRSTLAIGDLEETLPGIAGAGDAAALILDRLCAGAAGIRVGADNLVATGHRVVHGGELFSAPTRVTVSVFDALKSLSHLAPLHNPEALAAMQAVGDRFPAVPIVAVFDTAFFHDLPESVRTYAIPGEWTRRHGIRRYGFHGLAHEQMATRVTSLVRRPDAAGRAVTLHLGQGCSAAALRNGRPVETSMGFTPLEGLVMGTRCGDLDPGVLVHLGRLGLGWREIDDALNRESGLLGLSGASDDVRELLALEAERHAGAALALAAFYHRVHKYLGAYAAVLGGLGAIVFGGGIGEHSPEVRARICAGMHWLGLELDAAANAACSGREACISAASSSIEVHVVPVNEEPIIAEAALRVLGTEPESAAHG
ncbi:MAG TPA: acetate/propionate family kinase [Gammaproteobacteria bacterium]|nr:acetate/propionate family kinase [Gammaproteobacteria bacterium]